MASLGHVGDPHAGHRLRKEVTGGAPGHVIEEQGSRSAFGDRTVVLVQAGLGGLVIIWRNEETGVRAGLAGPEGQVERFGSRIGTRSGNHRNATIHQLHRPTDHQELLLSAQCRRLPGGPHRHDGIRAF